MYLKLLQKEQNQLVIGNKIADKILRVSKSSKQNNSETNEEEILRERYISPELRYKIIDDLRLRLTQPNINIII